MTDVSKELLPCDVKLPPATTITKGCKLETLLHALELRGMARTPAPADVVERVARAIREAQYPNGTSWDDWEEYHAANPGRFDGRDESRRLAKAALAAIPVSGEVERLREALSYGTLSVTKRMVVIDFETRERAEELFELLTERGWANEK